MSPAFNGIVKFTFLVFLELMDGQQVIVFVSFGKKVFVIGAQGKLSFRMECEVNDKIGNKYVESRFMGSMIMLTKITFRNVTKSTKKIEKRRNTSRLLQNFSVDSL